MPATTEEQSKSTEEVNKSIEKINRIASETAEDMDQSAQAVIDLSNLAQEMQKLVKLLQSE